MIGPRARWRPNISRQFQIASAHQDMHSNTPGKDKKRRSFRNKGRYGFLPRDWSDHAEESIPLVFHETGRHAGFVPFTVEDGVSAEVQFDAEQIAAFQKHKRTQLISAIAAIVVCVIVAIILIAVLTSSGANYNGSQSNASVSPNLPIVSNQFICEEWYCRGDMLAAVQRAGVFNDSKTFVDMPALADPMEILAKFETLPDKDNVDDLRRFVNENFMDPGADLIPTTPPDFPDSPTNLLSRISDTTLREWAQDIHDLWPNMSRIISEDVYEFPERRSLLPQKNNFIIVPGGRFRESYYWDAYWIIRGLLVSDMTESARLLIDNFLDLVDRFGFVPNGGRVYYLDRSQPPLLTLMAKAFYDKTGDNVFLKEALALLEQEHAFWMKPEHHAVEVTDPDDDSAVFLLNRYYADTDVPRPEGWKEDMHSAEDLEDDEDRATLFSNLVAGAESGWDYAMRWLETSADPNSDDLSKIITTDILPVELNSFLAETERLLSEFNLILGDEIRASIYNDSYHERLEGMYRILYSEEHKQWLDYDFVRGESRGAPGEDNRISLSNFIPLWHHTYETQGDFSVDISEVIDALDASDLLNYEGGVPMSLAQTKLQWDFPNAWSPIEHMIIEGLQSSSTKRGTDLAELLATNWLGSNYVAFRDTGFMHEKYDVRTRGAVGDGGEYEPQIGFGWTNGVVLDLLYQFGDKVSSSDSAFQ